MFTVVTRINLDKPQPEYDSIIVNLDAVASLRKEEFHNTLRFVDGTEYRIVEGLYDFFQTLDKANLIIPRDIKVPEGEL